MRGLAIATVVAVVRAAAAEPAPSESAASEATEIFNEARALAKDGRFDEACVLFAKSYDLDPGLGTAVNLADCLERQGKLYRAWVLFDLVARNSQNVQSRARLARDRADALISKLATVVVTLHDPGAPGLAVRIGDREVAPAAEIRDLVEPREIEIVVTLPGRPAFRTALHPVAGGTASIDIPAFGPLEEPAPPRRLRSRVYLADAIAAVGVAGLGVSLGFAIAARRQYTAALDGDCRQGVQLAQARCRREVESAGHRADLATGFVIGGSVLVAVAAAVYVTAPRDTVQVAPIASNRALGLGIVGRF
ncbi:MAG: hypothetical protein E6J90_46205 [Deltaproteobacteria bacterium]|nr:MAG: hypothetical protein E6J90_46205 [Deltaproteobacteria bacterium]